MACCFCCCSALEFTEPGRIATAATRGACVQLPLPSGFLVGILPGDRCDQWRNRTAVLLPEQRRIKRIKQSPQPCSRVIERDDAPIHHQSCDSTGKQITAWYDRTLRHPERGIRHLDHPLTPRAVALGRAGAREQTNPLTLQFHLFESPTRGNPSVDAHRVPPCRPACRRCPAEGPLQRAWATVERPLRSPHQQRNQFREHLGRWALSSSSAWAPQLLFEVIGVVEGEAASVIELRPVRWRPSPVAAVQPRRPPGAVAKGL